MARRSNPTLITLCCFPALMSLAFVFFLPYVCPIDGDDAGLAHVRAPVLVRTDADTLMHSASNDDCCRVHPSTGVVGDVPTLFGSAGAESHHQPVNFNCSVLSGTSSRILHRTRTDSSPPPAFAAVVGSIVTAQPELINPDLALVTLIINVLADRAVDERKKKKSGRMPPLLIMLLLAVAATGSAAADARGSGCSNDPNLPGRMHACGPPSVKPHN